MIDVTTHDQGWALNARGLATGIVAIRDIAPHCNDHLE
jgi:hypothetical protein